RVVVRLNPRVPFIAAIFPKSAPAASKTVEAVRNLDTHQILCVLVAELAFDAQPQRRAMTDRERRVVKAMRQNGLWVESIDQIDAFVILPGAVKRLLKRVGALEDDKASRWEKLCPREHKG